MRQDVGQRAHQHAEVAVERLAPCRSICGTIVIPGPGILQPLQPRRRQERLQMLLHRHRTAARAAAAMRRGERLVQIDVHHVDAEIARPRDAHQRIHIRAVHVDHGALGVQDLRAL